MSEPKLPTLTKINRANDAEEYSRRPLELKLYRRMFQYTSDDRGTLGWLVTCVLIRSTQGPLLAWLLARALNGPIRDGNMDGLFKIVAAYAALAFFTEFIFYHRFRLALSLGEGVVHNLRNDLFGHLQTMSMSYFTKTRLGRIISRFTTDVDVVRAGVQDSIFGGMVNGGNTLMAGGIMLYSSPRLFLIVLLTAPVYFAVYQYFRAKLSNASRVVQESYSRITATLAESVTGIRVTQSFARQDINAQLFNNLVEFHANNNMASSMASGMFVALIDLLRDLVIAMLFATSAFLVIGTKNVATVSNLILFYYLVSQMLGPLANLGNQYNTAVISMAGAERIFKMLDRKPELIDPPDAMPLPPIKGQVEFRDLSFAYDPGKLVLQEINFAVQPGQTIALVGHTGSGKSSIINLISKFYVPTSGQILIDGFDITRITTESLHDQMGIVLQANFLFTGTVMDNIRVGKPSATDPEVIESARQLGCLDMFEALPHGFNSVVGERGSGLSLGQRQLVCFTRALLADPRIIILDEATSAVDTVTEARIQQALLVLLQGRTSFVVAHRLSTIRHADVVLVLNQGRIVERGSHNDLLATGGVYANLYEQFIRASQRT